MIFHRLNVSQSLSCAGLVLHVLFVGQWRFDCLGLVLRSAGWSLWLMWRWLTCSVVVICSLLFPLQIRLEMASYL
jgi:hypothetical protein